MKTKASILLVVLAFALQLYVPAQMVLGRESITSHGKLYKFKTEPIDPNDPFRGKYIALQFEARRFKVDNSQKWSELQSCYGLLDTTASGYAKIVALSKSAPKSGDYVKVIPSYSPVEGELVIRFDFDRFYMEESKAEKAETAHRNSLQNPNANTYANIFVKNGEAVIDDVMIDGVSLRLIASGQEIPRNPRRRPIKIR
ncbi:MAG: hypothetical protein EOO50_02060 [Flavobacterium sp.]|uniref:GDYXXLXY domain-containing protein n=1 Tax=Flavobacterium sp. TaxID=239 RepID=UPI0011FDF5B0|nr:GDYXXLXY domain-containing protein [Flavobacterium sp.]RZJ68225.1 MAG: hypothetical protein EOO50_02060 [Flavobacterium sp.]